VTGFKGSIKSGIHYVKPGDATPAFLTGEPGGVARAVCGEVDYSGPDGQSGMFWTDDIEDLAITCAECVFIIESQKGAQR